MEQEKAFWIIENVDDIQQVPQGELNYFFIVHCWQGKLQVNINEQQFTLDKNHILLCLPSFLVGNYMRTPDCRCTVLVMQADYFEQLIDSTFHTEPRWWEKYTLLKENPILPLQAEQLQLLQAYYNLLKAYMDDEQTDFRQTMLKRLAEMAYYEISSYFDGIVQPQEEDQITQPDRLFRKFMNLLLQQKKYMTEREVNWYAEQLCITPKYLSTICREKSGKPASQWIRDTLVEQIRRELTETDLPIKDLSYRFNFPSQSFFGKFVRQHLGSSPQAYRTTHKHN